MTSASLFTGVNLFDHIGAWRCAVFATDVGLQLEALPVDRLSLLIKLLQDGTSEREAWYQVFGASMPQVLTEHLQLRRAFHTKAKHVSNLLLSWHCNYRALHSKPFTMYNTVAQRLQALAMTASTELVQQLMQTPDLLNRSVEEVQHELVQTHRIDLPLSAALACLLALNATGRQQPSSPLLLSGSLTLLPSSWDNVPVIKQVDTESGIPMLPGESNYAVLCYTKGATEATVRFIHESGEQGQLIVQLPVAQKPVWVSHLANAPMGSARQKIVIGCRHHIGVLHIDGSALSWSERDVLPTSNHCEKLNQYVVWQQAGKLLAVHMQNTYVLEDEEEVHQLCVQSVATGVVACNNVVCSNGVALFMLPPEFQQSIAAVHRVNADTVDVFTTLGDWWRVHVPTLAAHVVGLDMYPSTVVDACILTHK